MISPANNMNMNMTKSKRRRSRGSLIGGFEAMFAFWGLLFIGFIFAISIMYRLSTFLKDHNGVSIPGWIGVTCHILLTIAGAVLCVVVLDQIEKKSKKVGNFLLEFIKLVGLLAPIILAIGIPISAHHWHHKVHDSK